MRTAARSTSEHCPPCAFNSTSLRTPVRATPRAMSSQAASSDSAAMLASAAMADGLRRQHEHGWRVGQPRQRRAHETVDDERVGRERQMRAVLLDGGHGQHGDRGRRAEAGEIARRELLPVSAGHARSLTRCGAERQARLRARVPARRRMQRT